MSVDAFSSLPLSIGSAVASAAGRAATTAIVAYMRAPLRNTAIAGLVTLTAMAGSNALYKQTHHHPAPMFGSFSDAKPVGKKAKVDTVVPAARPSKLDTLPAPDTTGSVDAETSLKKTVDNADVLAIQQKLQALSLFDGKADGLFGPRTAKAIRAFELKAGLAQKGQLTPDIVQRIIAAPLFPEPAAAEPAPLVTDSTPTAALEPTPLTAPEEKTPAPLALTEESKPLPAPTPLTAIDEAAPVETPKADGTKVAELETPADAGASTLALTPASVAKRSVQTIAVRAAHAAPTQTMPEPLAIDAVEAAPVNAATDPTTVAAVQRGLASLGFLHGDADGVAGEATAKAIRNFEVYFNYDVTGRISRELVNLLVQNGAVI